MTGDEQTETEIRRVIYWLDHYSTKIDRTWEQVAVLAGISRSSLYALNRGSAPTLRTLAYVAAFLEIDVCDLLRPMPGEGTE